MMGLLKKLTPSFLRGSKKQNNPETFCLYFQSYETVSFERALEIIGQQAQQIDDSAKVETDNSTPLEPNGTGFAFIQCDKRNIQKILLNVANRYEFLNVKIVTDPASEITASATLE